MLHINIDSKTDVNKQQNKEELLISLNMKMKKKYVRQIQNVG